MKKADTYSQNKLKEMFKKSMLDDKDYIFDLEEKTISSNGNTNQFKF